MSLVLHVNGARWRAHLREVHLARPGLVPVVKGNGYGFGLARLARRTAWLGVAAVAVGAYDELAEVAPRTDADLVVLSPWRPFELPPDAAFARRVVHTVGRVEDVAGLLDRDPEARLVLEVRTSMVRHGLDPAGLRAAADVARSRRARVEGVSLHLPLARGAHLPEVRRRLDDVVAAGLARPGLPVWVSHLTGTELDALRTAYRDFEVRPRVGTDLWLGDRGALRVAAHVLDVHPLRRGEPYGYRGRPAPRPGHLLVVSGGTAHGIGLEAPTGSGTLKARATSVAKGGLDALGLVRSPFTVDGRQRLFAEPPHMQASMIFLPADARAPEVGDTVDVRVRYTTTWCDRVQFG